MNPETIEINGEIAYKYIYNGNYYITKSGNLYSTYIIGGQGKTDINKIHKVAYGQDRDGYYRVILSDNSNRKYIKIHQIVVNQFLGGCPKDMVVNHIDGDKHNNNVNNLEVITNKENIQHAWKTGLTNKENNPNRLKINVFDKKQNKQYYFTSLEDTHKTFPELSKRYINYIRKGIVKFNMCLFKKVITGNGMKDYYVECYYNGKLYKVFSNVLEAGEYFERPSNSVSSAFHSKYPAIINNYIITFPNVSTIESVA